MEKIRNLPEVIQMVNWRQMEEISSLLKVILIEIVGAISNMKKIKRNKGKKNKEECRGKNRIHSQRSGAL